MWAFESVKGGAMTVIQAERVRGADRRRWPRAQVSLPVRLIDTEATFCVLTGETLDLSVGGLRAHVNGPLSGEVETTVRLDLTIDQALVCEAMVAGGGPVGDGWEYRLAFRNLDPEDIAALELVVEAAL
jgi:hypothetical protein